MVKIIQSWGHRSIGAVLLAKGGLGMANMDPTATPPLEPLTFDNVQEQIERAAHGGQAGHGESVSDMLVGAALASMGGKSKKEPDDPTRDSG